MAALGFQIDGATNFRLQHCPIGPKSSSFAIIRFKDPKEF